MNGNESIVSPWAWKSWVAPSAIIVSGAARPACAETAARLPKEYPSVRPPVVSVASILPVSKGWGVGITGVCTQKFRVFSVGGDIKQTPHYWVVKS